MFELIFFYLPYRFSKKFYNDSLIEAAIVAICLIFNVYEIYMCFDISFNWNLFSEKLDRLNLKGLTAIVLFVLIGLIYLYKKINPDILPNKYNEFDKLSESVLKTNNIKLLVYLLMSFFGFPLILGLIGYILTH